MKAVVVTPGQADSDSLAEVPEPTLLPDQVLVRTLEVGVDGTDREIVSGLYGEAPAGSGFLILGHEGFGQVVAVGENVAGLRPGDLVVPTVRRPDDCPNCQRGQYDMCLYGNYRERGIKGLHGYMAEYFAEEPEHLVSIPFDLCPVAVLLEPLSIVEKGVHQAFKIQERMYWKPQRALVLGAGAIGLLATLLLRARGLETYTVATRPKDSFKASLVTSCGATYMDAKEEPLAKLGQRLGNLDIIVEATGNSSVAFQAMAIQGTNGVLCLTGVSAGNRRLEVPADALNLKMVMGNRVAFGTVNANRSHFQMGLADLADFQVRWPGLLSSLMTKRVPISNWEQALARGRDDIKVVVEVAAPEGRV